MNKKRRKFLCDFKPVVLQFCDMSNSECDSFLTGRIRRLSEPGPVLDNASKPAVGLGQGAGSGAFKSREGQANPGLWSWEWGLSHVVYDILGVSASLATAL